MIALRRRIEALTGWRRRGLAFALGALAVLALPPFHLVPVLAVSFTGLAWLALGPTRLSRRAAFAAGWWFGAGFFAFGLYWLANALLVDAARFGWMIPFAVGGMGAGLGLFAGLAVLLAHLAVDRLDPSPVPRALWLAPAWVLLEWLRGIVLTGFPWNLIGTVWMVSDAMLQPAAWGGVHLLSLMTVALAVLPAALGWRRADDRGDARLVAALLIGIPALWWTAGAARLALAGPAADGEVAGARLRLVQPAIPQNLKWDPAERRGHVVKQIAMSRAAGTAAAPTAVPTATPTHVIWAETAAPFYVDRDPVLRTVLAEAAPLGGTLIVGAPRATQTPGRPLTLWNSLHAIDATGAILATYDKSHLVPFGEYIPLRAWLPGWIAKVAHGEVEFSPGPGVTPLPVPGLPAASPLICYEAIFEGRVVPARGPRPGWLLNLTNDAWYGMSPGPYQHFAAARMRAVEEGLPLVRVANNGISAIVDSLGRVRAHLGLGREGVVDGPLPVALSPPLFARLGTFATPPALGVLALMLAYSGRRPRRRPE